MDTLPDDVRILVADDDETVIDLLDTRFRREGLSVETAFDGEEALKKVRSNPYDLVLVDVLMPYINGINLLQKIREDREPADLPVIMMVDRGNTGDMARALDAGANDCVEKPINFNVMLSRLRTQLELAEQHQRIQSLVQYDTDTKLFNRTFLLERLNVELARIRRHGGQLMVMVVEFKSDEGELPDHLLEETAEQLNQNLRQTDVLGRYDENEFGFILPETDTDYQATISRRLMRSLSKRGITNRISFSVGTATTDTGEPEAEAMFETARENAQSYDSSAEDQDQEAS
jgi:two-component system cell cycle response regulator